MVFVFYMIEIHKFNQNKYVRLFEDTENTNTSVLTLYIRKNIAFAFISDNSRPI